MVLKSSNCTEFDHKCILKILVNVKNVKNHNRFRSHDLQISSRRLISNTFTLNTPLDIKII